MDELVKSILLDAKEDALRRIARHQAEYDTHMGTVRRYQKTADEYSKYIANEQERVDAIDQELADSE